MSEQAKQMIQVRAAIVKTMSAFLEMPSAKNYTALTNQLGIYQEAHYSDRPMAERPTHGCAPLRLSADDDVNPPARIAVGTKGTVCPDEKKTRRALGNASEGHSVAVVVVAIRGSRLKVQESAGYTAWINDADLTVSR